MKYIAKDIPRVMSKCWAQRTAPGAYHFTAPKPPAAALEEPPPQSDVNPSPPEDVSRSDGPVVG